MIRCGHVYLLYCSFAAKNKLLVPAFVANSGQVRFFVINSNRTEFQEKRFPEYVLRLHCHLNTGFLSHDSWLACNELIGGWSAEKVQAKSDCYRGPLDDQTLLDVRALIRTSRLHSSTEKSAILEQWP